MAKFSNGFDEIDVRLTNPEVLNNVAEQVYKFGRLSHDFDEELPTEYDPENEACIKLINKIIEGTTLPKYAFEGWRLNFEIKNISRICLAQLTRDRAIFASQSGGVYALTQRFNIPMSIAKEPTIMEKLRQAQYLLEEAYIIAAEKEIPTIEARYIGLHCQTISLMASYIPTDFVRSCFSRTSSNFCDECNMVYRLMYTRLMEAMLWNVEDRNSARILRWLFPEEKCINDGIYTRERLYNSDFTTNGEPVNDKVAINDWRRSGWVDELKRIYYCGVAYLTRKEKDLIKQWPDNMLEMPTTYKSDNPEALVNNIKKTDYYKEHRK